MKDKFKALLMKKKGEGKVLDPKMAGHKMNVIENLMEAMGEDMGNNIKGMKKVTVAAPDQEGLEEGLEKAQDVVSEMPEMESEEMEPEIEEDEDEESDDVEALKARIAELEAKLSK